jgi:peptidoglycan hydrolase-like protein with peptidoglycan-binding domain
MTKANTQVIAKVAAVLAGAGLVLSSFAIALPAGAQTTTTTTTTSSSVTFARDLTLGSTGADVTALQTWLISKGFSIPAGATGYFGAQTQAAVAAYQAANGITPAAGYFGPITRAKVNGGGSVVVPGGDDDSDDDSDGDLNGGAGDLDDADFVSSLNNEEVGEGDDEVEVVGLELTADDGSDLEVTAVRVTLELDAAETGSEDLDDYAETLHLMWNGEEVASEDVEDIDEDDGEWTTTFSIEDGDAVVMADDSGDLTLAVTALSNIDSDDLDNNSWDVSFDMVRYEDAQGATISEDDLGDIGTETRAFEFSSFTQANDVELSIDDTSDSPESGTVEADEDGGDEIVLLVGTLGAEGSDIDLSELPLRITAAGTGNASEIASEFIFRVDGDDIASVDSDECVSGDCDATGTGLATYVFDDMDLTIDEDDEVEFEIVAVTNDIDGDPVAEGDSLTASVTDADFARFEVEAEGEDLESGDVDGAANGEEITLRTEGLAVDFNEDDSDARVSSANVLEFDFVLGMSAFGEDVDLVEGDFNYTVDGPGANTCPATGVVCSEDIDEGDFEEDGGTVTIEQGDDGELTFTVTIIIDGAADNGEYEVTLVDVDGVDVDESLSESIAYES